MAFSDLTGMVALADDDPELILSRPLSILNGSLGPLDGCDGRSLSAKRKDAPATQTHPP